MRFRVGLLCLPLGAAILVTGVTRNASAALVFNFGGGTGDPQADAGFQWAANNLQNMFQDSVTVNITSGFAALGAGILGSASSVQASYGFNTWKGAMTADQTSADDATMVGGLPGGATYSKFINRTADNPNGVNSATPYVHAGANQVWVTNGNAKALGLLAANQGSNDATITLSSNFTWDFDPSDGITTGAYDFVGVAMHELVHAMGFISGVDILDINNPLSNPPNGPFPAAAFDPFAQGLDFTRHSAASLAAGADMDWTVDGRAKDYSIDGGGTTLIANAWSLGSNLGDGRQASHWKDGSPQIGIMDPTIAAGSQNFLTLNDLQALDVIGWDITVIPEPGSIAVWSIILTCVVVWRRRRRAG